jgi:hypothetical protein
MNSTNDSKSMRKTTENEITKLQWVTKPDGAATYDEAFWVKKQRWGTFVSVLADDTQLITALTEELCISSTRWYLKQRQEGFTDDAPTYTGEVGGKL